MSSDYKVTVRIWRPNLGGTWDWIVERGTPATDFPILLDGMSIGWQMPDANVWPVQPDPITAKFSILAEDAADLDGIDRGIRITIRVWAGLTRTVTLPDPIGTITVPIDTITFSGRISDLVGTPHQFVHPVTGEVVDGWQLDVIAVDLTADLAERAYGYDRTGAVNHFVRHQIDAAFASAGLLAPAWGDAATWPGWSRWPEEVIQGPNLLAHVTDLLALHPDAGVRTVPSPPPIEPDSRSWYALYASQGWRRGILRPNLDIGGGEYASSVPKYLVEWVSRRPRTTTDWISADYIDFGAKWSLNKFGTPNVATVLNVSHAPTGYPSMDWPSITVSAQAPGETPVSVALSNSRLIGDYAATYLAEMYLDDPAAPRTQWVAAGFRWYASQDPAWPIDRSLFPGTHGVQGTRGWAGYAAPLGITGIPATQHPEAATTYTGVLRAVTFTLAGGEFTFDITLRPGPNAKAIT